MLNEWLNKVKALSVDLTHLHELMKIDALTEELEYLEMKMSAEDGWRDLQTNLAHASTKSRLADYHSLQVEYEELISFVEICIEENADEYEVHIASDYETLKNQIQKLKLEYSFSGEYDENDVILTVHAGAGGKEAQDWATMLLRMYTKWADKHCFSVHLIDFQEGEDPRFFKSATVEIRGKNAYGLLKNEKGVHRLVRVSPYDSQNRRHTSFAAIEVMPEISMDNAVEIDPKDLRVDVFRSSGKGGQHVNKTDSAVRVTHLPTGIVVSSQQERSQHQNKAYCMKVLLAKLMQIKEQEHYNNLSEIQGKQKPIQWGNQIRSYVFMPYQMVKDHRTDYQTGDINSVMDGNIDDFIEKCLAI